MKRTTRKALERKYGYYVEDTRSCVFFSYVDWGDETGRYAAFRYDSWDNQYHAVASANTVADLAEKLAKIGPID